jgi:hypothetical protein
MTVPGRRTWLAVALLGVGWAARAAAPAEAAPPPAPAVAAEAPLTNEEVVKLCALDLGDDLVVAKINQVSQVDFRLDADSLARVKQQRVSKDVILAMVKRASPERAGTVPPFPMPAFATPPDPEKVWRQTMEAARKAREPDVRLRTRDGEVALKGRSGEHSSTDIYVATLTFIDIAGTEAEVRTTDRRPSVLVRMEGDPRISRVFLVKLDSDEDDDKRSLKIGQARLFTTDMAAAPDRDWTVPYATAPEAAGVWRLTPTSDLRRGEYGVYFSHAAAGYGVAGEIYDFAVDG